MHRKLRPLLLLFIGLFTGLLAQAQAPAWQSAVAITTSGTGSAYTNATATDAAGNVYVAGQFSGTVNLGSFSFTSPIGNNGFVAKWSPATQRFSWARQLGGAVSGLATVGTSVYAVGYFSDAASFGSTTLTSAGDYDVFVVKLVDAGSSNTIGWVKQAGGPGSDRAETVAATSAGVYVAGEYASAAMFGSAPLTGSGAFATKLTDGGSVGSFAWTQQVVGSGVASGYGLAVAGSAVYLVGHFTQTVALGSLTLTTTNAYTAYVAKLVDAGATGSFSWAQAPANTTSTIYAKGVAVAGTSVYVVGDFTGTATFGSQTLTTAGGRDMFITKLTDNGGAGSFGWTQRAGGTEDELGQKIAVAGSSVYAVGSFRGTASFGAATLTSVGGGDVFISRLTDSGSSATFAWTQQAGGPGNENSRDVALSGAMPVLVGSFNATASFGNQAITSTSLYSENAFLALLATDVLATSPATHLPGLALYPNPAHGTATLRMPARYGAATLTLLDALGRVQRTQVVQPGTDCWLDLVGLAPGVYALRVEAGETVATRKLVVE